MCNSYTKCRVNFVACSGRINDSVLASWIERHNKGGILPTSDLGLSQLGPHILAADVDSTGRIEHGVLLPVKGEVESTRREHGELPRLNIGLRSLGALGPSGQARRIAGEARTRHAAPGEG